MSKIDMNLDVFVDSIEYIRSNCYQHQVLKTLERNFNVNIVTLNQMLTSRDTNGKNKSLSCLRLRTINNNLSSIKNYLGDRSVFVYEQDPWASFKDDSPYKGSYHRIFSTLNVSSFLNTSNWWSSYIRSKNLPSTFVRMGVLPEYCSHTSWEMKDVDVGFCGQLHPYRKKFFDYLETRGIKVQLLPTTNYLGYLQTLSRIKVFAHCEKVEWIVDGQILNANALWIKDVEACARGCISIRDFEKESLIHGSFEENPAKMGFEDFESGYVTIKEVIRREHDINNAITEKSVRYVKDNLNWMDIVDTLKGNYV